VLVVQVVRGWELALFVARAVGEVEVRVRNPKNDADDNSTACSNCRSIRGCLLCSDLICLPLAASRDVLATGPQTAGA